MNNNWKKNIPLYIRLKVSLRNWYISSIYNPYQVFRRRSGLAGKDLFENVKIQTNYRCTRKCSFCHYGLETSPVNTEMYEKLYYHIIKQLEDISYRGRIGLFEINEPLTDKRLLKFLSYARKHLPRVWLFLTTNGDLLKKGDIESIFAVGLNYLYINSYDEKAYSRNLNLMDNLEMQYKKKVLHIDRTYQTTWTSRAGNLKQYIKECNNNPCDMIYNNLYIKPSGKVFSCINDFYDVNEMGDLNKETIVEVWYGETFSNLRRQINRGNRNCNSLCAQCDYIGYTNLPKIPIAWKVGIL